MLYGCFTAPLWIIRKDCSATSKVHIKLSNHMLYYMLPLLTVWSPSPRTFSTSLPKLLIPFAKRFRHNSTSRPRLWPEKSEAADHLCPSVR